MKYFTERDNVEVAQLLNDGHIGVIRTDTLYGILAKADDEVAVKRVFDIKHRADSKSPIVLISNFDQLFDDLTLEQSAFLESVWPGKVSAILPSSRAPEWIKRSNNSVAYRLPNDAELCALIGMTGPLIAPSANRESDKPAMTIQEAVEYFGDSVDFYIDSGEVTDPTPSMLIRCNDDGVTERLR